MSIVSSSRIPRDDISLHSLHSLAISDSPAVHKQHQQHHHGRRSLREKISSLRRSRRMTVAAVSVGIFVDMVVYGVVVPILPERLSKEFGLSGADVGILFSVYSIGLLAVTPLVGWLSDKYSVRRLPMLVGLLFLGLSTIAFGLATEYWQLVVARMAQGLSGGVSWTMGFCVIADIYEPEVLGEVMGKVFSANTLGFLIGPPLGGILYHSFGYTTPFIVCSILAFLDFAAWLFILPTKPSRPGQHTRAATTDPVGDNDEFDNLVSNLSSPVRDEESSVQDLDSPSLLTQVKKTPSSPPSMFSLLSNSSVLVTLVTITFISSVMSGIEPTMPIHLNTLFGFEANTIGLLFIALVVPSAVCSILVGKLSDKYGRKNIEALGCFFFSFAAVGLAYATSIPALITFLVLFGATGSIAITPTLPELGEIVARLGGGANGQIYALFNTAYGLGMVIGPLSAGVLFENLGFISQMWLFSALLLAWSFVVAAYWYFRVRKRV